MRRVFTSMALTMFMLAATLSNGCYFDRLTGKYDEVPELESTNPAVLEISELSQEEQERRYAELQALAEAPPEPYTINSGDKLEIVVYNHPDLSLKTTVTPDGHIGMVLVGQVKLAGLTIPEAAAAIEKSLSRYIRNPRVGISPFEIVSEHVTIAGAIARPGIYPIFDGMRLADIIAKAGGTATRSFAGQTIDAADLENSLFVRGPKLIPVNFSKAIERGDPLHNVQLHRGDYIYVATRENSMVYIIGEVRSPGQQFWSRQLGLLEVVSLCGGVNENHWSHAIIIRGGLNNPKMYKVDLDGVLSGKFQNVLLKPNDIVYIPKDNISEYNVFIRKLMPTAQLINMLLTPGTWVSGQFF